MLPRNGSTMTTVKYTTLLGASTSCHLLVIENRFALNRAAGLTDTNPNGMYPLIYVLCFRHEVTYM
jgi:hypothetical protein